MKIILAQGNPEKRYDHTRHNVGFAVVDAFVDQHDATWVNKSKFQAHIAELTINNEKILLVKPTTFYNETGQSARKLIDFYNITPEHDLLVIHDDLALPFGTIRTRKQGSDAGNNGIKSLNNHIGPDYYRIRIGIYNGLRENVDDATFVLSKFSKEDTDTLTSDTIPHAMTLIDDFIVGDLKETSHVL